jgi:hypothetical protein
MVERPRCAAIGGDILEAIAMDHQLAKDGAFELRSQGEEEGSVLEEGNIPHGGRWRADRQGHEEHTHQSQSSKMYNVRSM